MKRALLVYWYGCCLTIENIPMTKPLLTKSLLGLCLFIILLSCSPKLSSSSTEPVSRNAAIITNMEESILKYVNAHRRSIGKEPLQMLDAASKQAYKHSNNMATGKTEFSHNGFDQRIKAIEQSIGRTSADAENVAYGNLTAKGVVDVWLNSPGHRKNMEGSYNLTGIGVSMDREGTAYFTEIFLRK